MLAAWLGFSCLVATSLMTAFSYAMSALMGKQFREPELLNKLVAGLLKRPLSRNHISGWVLHYGVGLLFVIVYYIIFNDTHPAWWQYAIAGAISGIAGVIAWFVAFTLHPAPPAVDRKRFYLQLIPAHVIFGLGAYVNYCFAGV